MFPPLWCKKLSIALLLLGTAALFGCKHEPTKPQPLAENSSGAQQYLVEEGESSQAVYNGKGDKLLFISRRPVTHQQNQVYEKDLTTGVERRITYQNGNTFQPRYHLKEGWIVYSSSTDELKENPPLLNPSTGVSKLPYPYQEPIEIYVHNLRGLDIVRVTEHLGFDGEARFTANGENLTYTHVSGQKTEVLLLNRATRAIHPIKGLGVNPTLYTGSADGKAHAWIDWDESFGVGKLRLQKAPDKTVELAADMIVNKTDLNFSPDAKYLFWSQTDPETNHHDLWLTDLQTLCAQRVQPVAEKEDERRDPTLSPDMKWLTFTELHKERSRIARVRFTPPSGPCPSTP